MMLKFSIFQFSYKWHFSLNSSSAIVMDVAVLNAFHNIGHLCLLCFSLSACLKGYQFHWSFWTISFWVLSFSSLFSLGTLFFFLIWTYNAIYFLLNPAYLYKHILVPWVFIMLKHFLLFVVISYFIPWLCRNIFSISTYFDFFQISFCY